MNKATTEEASAQRATDCQHEPFLFPDLFRRKVQADFTGGTLSSDGGVLFLRQIDRGMGITAALARCFHDHRDARFVDHALEQLLRQRIYGLGLGYEDLNDHTQLRRDPLLAAACEKADPLGRDRLHDTSAALAGVSTLNRLELSNNKHTRRHKLPHDPAKVESCLLTMGVRCLPKHAKEIVLDLDSMGHLVHGLQEGRHFSAYYGDYCYLPLYIVAGDIVLWAELRTADRDGADGVVPALEKIVPAIRRRCPKARIIVRGDSGFAREEIMAWCEAQRKVDYCLGLAKNSVLLEKLVPALCVARQRYCLCGGATVREFAEFEYKTQKSWSRERRVVGKAEVMAGGDNPRFIVTSLAAAGRKQDKDSARFEPARLYEELYCARGEMENLCGASNYVTRSLGLPSVALSRTPSTAAHSSGAFSPETAALSIETGELSSPPHHGQVISPSNSAPSAGFGTLVQTAQRAPRLSARSLGAAFRRFRRFAEGRRLWPLARDGHARHLPPA